MERNASGPGCGAARPGPGPDPAGRGAVALLENGEQRTASGAWWAPALRTEERAGGIPDWAEWVEQVLAATPAALPLPEEEYEGLSGFERVLAPFAEAAGDRMAAALGGEERGLVDLAAVRAGLVRAVGPRLARIAARVLVTELHRAREAGGLTGGDSRARFREFLRRAGGRRGLAALLKAHPVLARLLGRVSLDAADAFAELLRRLVADHVALAEAGLPCGSDDRLLVDVEAGAGDSHGGGRTVALLRFADGTRLVYKPRPVAAHRHFNDLADWLGRLPGAPRLRTLTVLDRGTHGWVEFVEVLPCRTEPQVREFYRRQGALLALLHALDGTDLHHENLIAHGEHPVLVDVETLFHPALPIAASDDPASRALHDSVHRVGLLPQFLLGDDSALDMSAVGGGRAALSPVALAGWADCGTDTMRLVRRPGRFRESANRPRLHERTAEPAAYTAELCEGFRAAYTALGEARAELLGPTGLLERFRRDEVRVVARPTAVYATLLDETTHPELMREAGARDAVLARLREGTLGHPALPGLEDEEIAQLWSHDVPVFTVRAGGTALTGVTGRAVPGTVPISGLARATGKIAALDSVDRQDQEWVIRAAMVSASTTPAHHPAGPGRGPRPAFAPEPERLLAAARSLGDQLVSLAYRAADRANWLGLELLGDRYWRLGPMPADLAAGYCGPALFLAQLADVTGVARYAETASASLAPVAGLLDALHEDPTAPPAVGSGAFAGLGGITYTLLEVERLLGEPACAESLPAALRLLEAAAAGERETGVGAGTAGGLAVLLAAHRATGRPETLRAAGRCAERLAAAGPPAGPGFLDGSAGTGWALLRYAERSGAPRFREAGLEALREAVAALPAANGAADEGWCHGRAGIALAVADSPAALADHRLAAWLTATARLLRGAGPRPDDSLCHGEAGLLELLGHGALAGARAGLVHRTGALLASVEDGGPRCGTPDHVPHAGLLTGLAGIGHGLLRAGFPDRVPSVLLLDLPTLTAAPDHHP
ncbi:MULTISPECIES: type 2 lanthipeptide synthetase LanM family protein [Streptomyces]|uniref:type 2 lanthipeptide synthetase LanM family protein n=3 Tax=Streptomyces TaxID=1883 RepID=UPI002789FC65|nr:type 2 lanthipeptide synthetase LanM family protein [Streptomyces sp. DSM 41037]MDQ0292062.1 type 2 lantibiotic biosynthesis protein LanM [Streptomyces sp. DSM 41037]